MAEPEPGSFWQKQTNAAAAAIIAGLPFSEADTRAYGKFIHFSEDHCEVDRDLFFSEEKNGRNQLRNIYVMI